MTTRKTCSNDHPITPETEGRDTLGRRFCRTCRSERTHATKRAADEKGWQTFLSLLPKEEWDWRRRARCGRGSRVDHELFHPISPSAVQQIAEAKRMCAGCPVRRDCLSAALRAGDTGIRGGTLLDEDVYRDLRQKAKAA